MGADEIDARAASLYGDVEWKRATGLLQVAAIHGPSDHILAIGPEAPPGPTDRFALGLARARSDVLITTGSILRAEPELVHRYAEDADDDRAMSVWRSDTLGLTRPPRLLVLSATGRFPQAHPALVSGEGWIWTTDAGAREIGDAPRGFTITLAESGRDSAAHALAWLRSRIESEGRESTLLLEAGPSTSRPFYEEQGGAGVDELLLSRFEGPIPEAAEGPDFVPAEVRAAHFGAACSSCVVEEASGRWTFERFRRGRD